ncbi:MAG: hypothetical protein K8T90_06195 [Planctomycetes bacterium]|nr:hypothetical protein [Planctomycetota bacterium]
MTGAGVRRAFEECAVEARAFEERAVRSEYRLQPEVASRGDAALVIDVTSQRRLPS